ncbi:hypothetical protein EN904_03025 [Mesorhizobium sp. M7A.F.Ca.CA.001.07.2.1]|uniref:TfuA-like protein n=1 Tax=unclassified Mesorhizobium TaxID=325217 RepID=UPI000FCB33F9|nr:MULTISPECIES: TfuA-like protein [Mesorhizobium]MCF6126608.1 hypothetical protein [Mesorhizobium ciceri]MCQ8817708.1 TfuA-like protein [Mesorhizobium sp. SEMIA396]MCQ8871913.1 TfuA-like protein [Mesorhizobium sp. LMG17149]RUX68848.1 hypothetical protein EN983_29455 [Mesorhizobium sp. M7A.F.Ca.CA.004.08.2.1]RUX88389.1 hypothetical protein EN982_06740 [Mesorhizobium sp. M7A.F.Ca.CA.004.08.1.1]
MLAVRDDRHRKVFEDYLTGRRSADADVAMIHGPAEIGYLPLTVPLVDVADVLQRMVAADILDGSLARRHGCSRQDPFQVADLETGIGRSRHA